MVATPAESLETRVIALHEAHKTTIHLINRLLNIKFQPGSLAAQSQDADVRTELTTEIHETLKNEDDELESLRQEIQDLLVIAGRKDASREQEQARLNIQVARIAEDFKLARARFRSAQVQSKRNAALARAQERDLLFSSKEADETVARRRTERKGGQDEAVAASGDVTAALRRTQQLLQTELQRSHFAQEIFNESSEAIKQLSQSYNDLDSLLSSSKTLLTTLVKSNKSDTWYLETTVYVLLATIAWLFFRRFLYGPAWWLVYLPIKLTFRTIYTIYGVAGFKFAAENITAVSASLSTASTQTTAVSSSAGSMTDQPKNEATSGGDQTGKHPLSDKIAQLAESEGGKQEQVVRGDGTVLENSDAPRNPKKRVFEMKEDAEVKADTSTKDEL